MNRAPLFLFYIKCVRLPSSEGEGSVTCLRRMGLNNTQVLLFSYFLLSELCGKRGTTKSQIPSSSSSSSIPTLRPKGNPPPVRNTLYINKKWASVSPQSGFVPPTRTQQYNSTFAPLPTKQNHGCFKCFAFPCIVG